MSTTTRKFKTVITDTGAKKLAQAAAPDGKPVRLTHMAVGDGGGTLPTPDSKQTRLVHEVWRHTVNRVILDATHQNRIIAELVIPPETGGFWIREIGVFDEHGDLIAVGNTAESYKPAVAEGSGRAQTFRTILTVSSTATVELTVDNTMVMATVDYVDDKLKEHEQSRRHPDASLTAKGFVQLSSATDSASETQAATPKAVSEVMENAEGRLSKEQNGRDIPDKAAFVKNVGAARAYGRDISLGAGEWTTSEFVAWLKAKGAFDQPYWMMKASLMASVNKVITDTGLGKINLGGCAIEVMGTYDAAIVRVTIGEYGMTGFLNGTVCTCTVYGSTQYFHWRADYTTKNKPDAASTTQKGMVQLSSATNSTSETLAATAKAVKIAMDNASARLAKDRNGADIPNKPLFIQNVGLQETVNRAGNSVQRSGDKMTGELKIDAINALRIFNDAFGLIFRRSEDFLHFIPTAEGQGENGDIGPLRPFAINLRTGAISVGHGARVDGGLALGTDNALGGNSITLGDNDTGFKQNGDGILDVYANSQRVFRFQNGVAVAFKNIQAGDSKKFTLSSSNSSTKNAGFNLWGNASRPVVAELGDDSGWHFYSQRNTDNSVVFGVNGQIQPGNWGNFDSRYVKDVRLGTRVVQLMARGGRYEKAGHAITGLRIIGEVDGDDEAIFRPIQKYINGTWYNVAQV